VSLLLVTPEWLMSAAADVEGIGTALNAANVAAAIPTTGLAPAAADEVSAAVAALLAKYGQEYQALSARANAFGQQIMQALSAGAASYVATEAAGASLLQKAHAAAGSVGGTGTVDAAINNLNLRIGGETSIYNLRDPRGWAALLLDYTWGFPGTALGYGVRLINQFEPTAVYDPALSELVGWHVFHGGIGLPGFTTTMGNVTTHLGYGPSANDVLVNHEGVHVWQSRIFGPLFQTSYAGWMVGGFFVGTGYWFLHPNENWFSLVETAAYYDNPWEVWAYVNDHNWPPPGANPALLW
jgi:hypothetical protein